MQIQYYHGAQHLNALEQCYGSLIQEEASRKLIAEIGSDTTKDEQDLLNTDIEINRNGRTYQTGEAEPIYELLTAIPCMSIVSYPFCFHSPKSCQFPL